MIGKVLFLFVLILMYKFGATADVVIGVSVLYCLLSLAVEMVIAYYFPQLIYEDDEYEDE